MKKKFLTILVCLSMLFLTFAQDISEEELRSVGDRSSEIVFDNYVGPVTEFSTIEEIRGIGSYLASTEGNEINWGNKYKVIRSFQPEIPEGLDADVFIILPDAGVDHIDNLRRIISAYIEGTFSYNKKQSDVLAEFVTYYNAVYYKNIQHFSNRYKAGVLSYLSPQDAGLSTHYSEWPGKSKIVIPLKTDGNGGSSSLDNSIISSDEVIEEMQKEDDKALDSRKEMVEIREEELDEKQEILDEEKKVVEEKEEQIEEELVELEKELEEVEPDSPEEQILEEKKEELLEEQKAVEEVKQELEEKQEEIDKEQKEVVEIREDIAKDENILREEATESTIISSEDEVPPEGFLFILVDKSGDPSSFGSLVKVTLEGEILQKSELNSVRGTSFTEGGNGIIVIAGKNEGRSTVKAMILDSETLAIQKESNSEIYPGSHIWTEGNNLFMICRNDQKWALGLFDQNLELKQISSVDVNPDTAVVFVKSTVLVQSEAGAVIALDPETLKEIKK